MQPNQPIPNPPSGAPRPGFFVGPGILVGVIALLAFVYMIDHGVQGDAAVFGSVDRRVSAQDFHGGRCTAIFGGCKIDLRDAQMQGREAVLTTYAIFGDVEIRVPEDWEVVSRGAAVFGGFENRTRRLANGAASKTLILDGAAVFGGVSVKD